MDKDRAVNAIWNEFMRSGNPAAYLLYRQKTQHTNTGALDDCSKMSWPL